MFDEPVVDSGQDEVGELARAFERMRRRLAQLDHARREFIANASHELRTPVFSLGGFLELLDDEELDEETRREFLTTMREQVQRLEKLATELLDLSRLDAGHIDLDREACRWTRWRARRRGVRGRCAPERPRAGGGRAEGALLAIADEQRLAADREDPARERARAHAERAHTCWIEVPEDRGRARLSVSDDGPGIDDAEAANIFERFYRVDGAQASGSGLGLAIARELVRLMGGSLELERSEGRTAFAVTLAGSCCVCRKRDNGAGSGRT